MYDGKHNRTPTWVKKRLIELTSLRNVVQSSLVSGPNATVLQQAVSAI